MVVPVAKRTLRLTIILQDAVATFLSQSHELRNPALFAVEELDFVRHWEMLTTWKSAPAGRTTAC
jgi:hypothetical protein